MNIANSQQIRRDMREFLNRVEEHEETIFIARNNRLSAKLVPVSAEDKENYAKCINNFSETENKS